MRKNGSSRETRKRQPPHREAVPKHRLPARLVCLVALLAAACSSEELQQVKQEVDEVQVQVDGEVDGRAPGVVLELLLLREAPEVEDEEARKDHHAGDRVEHHPD